MLGGEGALPRMRAQVWFSAMVVVFLVEAKMENTCV